VESNAALGEQPRTSALANRATPDGASFILRSFDRVTTTFFFSSPDRRMRVDQLVRRTNWPRGRNRQEPLDTLPGNYLGCTRSNAQMEPSQAAPATAAPMS
jgi:hypothetical protein